MTPQDFHLNLDELVHHTGLPQTRPSQWLDSLLEAIGKTVAWLWVVLMAVIVVNVLMRYALGQGYIFFEEIQWHIYSVGFLVGLSYCLVHDDHVRVDILHDRLSLRTQAWLEFFGLLIFLLPFTTTVMIDAMPFVINSYDLREVSDAPGGLPYRWLIKSALPVGFVLLWLAALSRLLRCSALLWGLPRPLPAEPRG